MPLLPTLDYEYTDREVTDTFAGYNHKLKIGGGVLRHGEPDERILPAAGREEEARPCKAAHGSWRAARQGGACICG